MPSASRHTRTVLSRTPLTMMGVPSGSAPIPTAVTPPVWPSGSPTGVPSASRHTRPVPSSPPITGVPSGSAATGAKLWVRRYSEPAGALNVSTAIAVSPDGSTGFVTGWSRVTSSEWADATVAYLTATGRRLWVQRYDEPAGEPYPAAIAVSPDGSTVFVTGGNYATVAYRAATGGLFWTARYSGGTNANAVVASPDGSKVFVTGYGNVGGGQDTYTTVAYSS